jgi:hypothetical protein
MDTRKFTRSRPYLYHLTARENIAGILNDQRIHATSELLKEAKQSELIRSKRPEMILLSVLNRQVRIRDQAPLYAGNCTFPQGFSFNDLIEILNSHVFFWPGTASSPIDYGIRHFERYESEGPVILRVSTDQLFASNPGNESKICRYNSGAPRCTQGKGSPRGPEIFQRLSLFSGNPSQVREITFETMVILPSQIEISKTPNGPWQSKSL